MRRYVPLLVLVVALGIWLGGAGAVASQEATPAGAATPGASAVSNRADLVAALRAKDLTVEEVDRLSKPMVPFQGAQTGTVLRLSGDGLSKSAEITVYEYADDAALAADAEQILPDGSLETTKILWIEPPHFFESGQVLALYLGSDQEVLDLLTGVLGPQFAGA